MRFDEPHSTRAARIKDCQLGAIRWRLIVVDLILAIKQDRGSNEAAYLAIWLPSEVIKDSRPTGSCRNQGPI